MAVRKYVKFAAPYSSSTFNKVNKLLGGINGVVNGGDVSTSGSFVTIQPMTFIQNGLFVDIDAPLTATLPASLTAPYFAAVTVSSGIENLAEVITPTFVKRPQDVSDNTVLVAEYDGQEWRSLPKLQLEEIYLHEQLRAKEMDFKGVATGLGVTQDSTTITVAKGAAVSTDGTLVKKDIAAVVTKVAADADGLDRVDEVVLRKPIDSPYRVADVEYVVGPTFDYSSDNVFYTENTLDTGGTSTSTPKILNSQTANAHYFLYISSGDLVLKSAPNALTPVSSPVTVATTSITEFDAVLNPAGTIDLLYIRGTNLYHKQVSTAGVPIVVEHSIYSNLNTILTPKMVSVKEGAVFKLHATFVRSFSVSEYRLMYTRLTSAGVIDTNAQSWVNLLDILANPSLAKDDDDALLFLAFENTGTGRLYLKTYDASTPTLSSPPTQLGASIELQDDTFHLDSFTLMPTTNALTPIVKRTSFKETYVFWRHFKGSGSYGLACYHRSYQTTFGHKAVVRDLVTSGENVQSFDVDLDGLNNAYVAAFIASNGRKSALRLDDFTITGTTAISFTTPPTLGVSILFAARGALIHGGSASGPNKSFFLKSSAGIIHNLRDFQLAPCDVYLAHFRRNDGVISVAGTAIEEDSTIRRLYEYNNLYASGGVATWGKVGSNILELVANLVIRFFNRRSTYTVLANSPSGISIPNDNVCFVQIPEDDTSQTLTLQVKPFGEGILDRYNRNTFPLFWNIGGNLYMRFAPWRAEAGDTIIIGEGMTNEMKDWLGASDFSPDPLNHAYSGYILLPSDSHESALVRLDQALKDLIDQTPEEESTIVGFGGTTTFTAGTIAWFITNAIPDMSIYWNGMKLQQAQDGNIANGDFIKTSSTSIQFGYNIPQFAKITARQERQYSGGGGGGNPFDLENIQVDIQPDLNANHSVGTVTKAWKSVFLKDKAAAQVYELEIVSGNFQVTAVP